VIVDECQWIQWICFPRVISSRALDFFGIFPLHGTLLALHDYSAFQDDEAGSHGSIATAFEKSTRTPLGSSWNLLGLGLYTVLICSISIPVVANRLCQKWDRRPLQAFRSIAKFRT